LRGIEGYLDQLVSPFWVGESDQALPSGDGVEVSGERVRLVSKISGVLCVVKIVLKTRKEAFSTSDLHSKALSQRPLGSISEAPGLFLQEEARGVLVCVGSHRKARRHRWSGVDGQRGELGGCRTVHTCDHTVVVHQPDPPRSPGEAEEEGTVVERHADHPVLLVEGELP